MEIYCFRLRGQHKSPPIQGYVISSNTLIPKRQPSSQRVEASRNPDERYALHFVLYHIQFVPGDFGHIRSQRTTVK